MEDHISYYLHKDHTILTELIKIQFNELTLESTNTISIVSPPWAVYCFHMRIIFTLILHIDLYGFNWETSSKPAIDCK